jgi:hypothetical protein
MRVVIIKGHYPGPDRLFAPIGTSTLEAVLEQSDTTPEQKADVRETMRLEKYVQLGGGAQPERTIYEESAWNDVITVVKENHPGLA